MGWRQSRGLIRVVSVVKAGVYDANPGGPRFVGLNNELSFKTSHLRVVASHCGAIGKGNGITTTQSACPSGTEPSAPNLCYDNAALTVFTV